jgi:hypothetical protein
MIRPRQFSLSRLFLIVFLVAVALGLWRLAPAWDGYGFPGMFDIRQILQIVAAGALGAAAGCFNRTWLGVAIGAGLMAFWFTFLWALDELVAMLTPI